MVQVSQIMSLITVLACNCQLCRHLFVGTFRCEIYLLHALNDLLEDDGFKRGTDRLEAVVEVAKKVKEWVERNNREAGYFQQQLLRHMGKYLDQGVHTVARREKMP